jgi:hypothetical protein
MLWHSKEKITPIIYGVIFILLFVLLLYPDLDQTLIQENYQGSITFLVKAYLPYLYFCFARFATQWYSWSDSDNKFIKIVPINIGELLTPIGLAHWIMDDGFSTGKAIGLCTESFTLAEVELLSKALKSNFDLVTTINVRHMSGGRTGFRLIISGRPDNYSKIRSIVRPFFIPSMFYKLDGGKAPEELN